MKRTALLHTKVPHIDNLNVSLRAAHFVASGVLLISVNTLKHKVGLGFIKLKHILRTQELAFLIP